MKYNAIFVILTTILFCELKELYWMFWSQSWITLITAKKVAVVLKTGKKYPDFHGLQDGERCYSTLTLKWSIQFFHKILIIKYALNMQYAVSCGFFLTLKFSCLFPAVAVLACFKSLLSYSAGIQYTTPYSPRS